MKARIYSILFLLTFSVYAQDPQLFQYDWRLESIETDIQVYTPSPSPNPMNFGTDFDYLYFHYDSSSNYYQMSFGIFNNVWGDDLVFDNSNSSFNIPFTYLTLGESSPASNYFSLNFLNAGFNGAIENPFSYDFSYINDLVYLYIINQAGSIATFYANNLSQAEFLKTSISMYPNPVKNILYFESAGIAIENVKVYDLRGRLVEAFSLENEYQIDVSNLLKGVYIIEIETAIGVMRDKLVKK
jgi:hypothetical protein